jgi:hypothetical protein
MYFSVGMLVLCAFAPKHSSCDIQKVAFPAIGQQQKLVFMISTNP